jgi:hypothetical protein
MTTRTMRLAIAGVAATLVLAVPSLAATTITAAWSTGCSPATGQLCANVATVPIDSAGILELSVRSSTAQAFASCSTVRYHVYVDGTEVWVTPFLAPGESTPLRTVGPVGAGAVLTFRAEGNCAGALDFAAGAATLQLTEAPRTPTTKNDCKNGGWKTFTTLAFKNQGDCVSFVATEGRNQPAG